MKNLRTQLLSSHLALVGLMAFVMTGAVVNFFTLGRSIDRILKDNYKSVIAAQTMKEALERQDSATTFFLAGQEERARTQYRENWPRFQKALEVESNNITETGEQQISDDITRGSQTYRRDVERLLLASPQMPEAEARDFYLRVLEPQFVTLKARAQDVLELNQAAIVRADERAKAEARRGSYLGIGMTLGALLLAVLFAHRAINSALTPLVALAQGAEEIGAGHLNRRIELNRSDEIGTLANSFNTMAQKLSEARRIEQQRLHRAQKMSDAALESLYDPVIVTDATGSVVQLNRAAQGLFGPVQNASGLPIAQVVNEPRIAEALERAVRQERVSAEEGEEAFIPLQVGGTQHAYRLRATPMRDDDGALLGAALVLEDITHLREVSRLKTEFIGVASHELRTPVTSLLLSAQLLQEGAAGPLSEAQQEIVAAQREDLARLDQLLRDLLDISRLEDGATPPRFESVPPLELVDAAHDSVASQAQAKGMRLQIEAAPGLPRVRADRAQVTRVLINLLGNALRHTPAESQVGIEARREGERVLFRVSDTGAGIPAEYLPRIFDRFVQVPGATRGGAGLGLSIAQTIIKAHGGEISVESTVGKGSTFSFSLSAAKE
jgi:NtrC-family two-component system sensor histidine kinase KinB